MPKTMVGLTLDEILAHIGMTMEEVDAQALDVVKIGARMGGIGNSDDAIRTAFKAAQYTVIMGRWETLSYLDRMKG